MIYGDGAFKDPVGKIWELADPVVGAGYTDGLDDNFRFRPFFLNQSFIIINIIYTCKRMLDITKCLAVSLQCQICVTEAVVARADGNYASTEDIAADVKAKLGGGTVGVVFPILSRNRFE